MLVFGATFILKRFTARQKVATILSIIAGLADFILGLIALITGILRLKIWLLLLWWTLLKHRLLARHISCHLLLLLMLRIAHLHWIQLLLRMHRLGLVL